MQPTKEQEKEFWKRAVKILRNIGRLLVIVACTVFYLFVIALIVTAVKLIVAGLGDGGLLAMWEWIKKLWFN